MTGYRDQFADDIGTGHIDSIVKVAGWVHRIRDHGGLMFIDLRDHSGLIQCVAEPGGSSFEAFSALTPESVISVSGSVRKRPPGTELASLKSGNIEICAIDVDVLSGAIELPLPVFGEPDYPEDIRLKHRYLDLRREGMQANIRKRSAIISSLRKRMENAGFTEFQTPILTASSPEGARDFLVPSRTAPGKFYALPQAPQLYKQLIIMGGFPRYFQIAPCFRDEDARADRSPGEFYQLDVEMSFVTQSDVLTTIEPILRGLFEEFADGATVSDPFTCLTYREALDQFGTDKPDLRNPIRLANADEIFGCDACKFNAFKSLLKQGGTVIAIPAPGSGDQPRSFFDGLNDWARREHCAPGLGYISFAAENDQLVGRGPIAKFLSAELLTKLAKAANIGAGDSVFFAAGNIKKARELAAHARNRIAEKLNLIEDNTFKFAWVVDFPMFEWNEQEKKVDFSHNPFSMPQGGLDALNGPDPLTVLAYQYDIVCNGIELSSGAIRNHRPELLRRAFEIAGHGEEVLIERFGGLYRALHYGVPPHGGIAPGLERIVMLLCGETNLRQVNLFPLNQQAEDLLLGSPARASAAQLRELGIKIRSSA